MLITGLDRKNLLAALPKGGIVAEIGVLRGNYSSQIWNIVEPETLHLIDPWGRLDEPNRHYPRSLMQEAHETVKGKFRTAIEANRVVLHQHFSTNVAPEFSDHSFDWIYIDGKHDYESVRADLLAFRDKVKPTGFILGHDFSTYRNPNKFGVVRAVREFTAREGFSLILVTNEKNPSYLLARSDNDTTLPELKSQLLDLEGGWPIEVSDALLDRYEQVEVSHGEGKKGRIMKFS